MRVALHPYTDTHARNAQCSSYTGAAVLGGFADFYHGRYLQICASKVRPSMGAEAISLQADVDFRCDSCTRQSSHCGARDMTDVVSACRSSAYMYPEHKVTQQWHSQDSNMGAMIGASPRKLNLSRERLLHWLLYHAFAASCHDIRLQGPSLQCITSDNKDYGPSSFP